MTIQTFTPPIKPSPGSTRKPELKLLKSEFGDGYTQTARDGLNHKRDVLEIQWDYLTAEQADQIIAFFEAHGGDTPFLYIPPAKAQPVRFTCADWEETYNVRTLRSVKATFRQDFNLT